MEYNLKPNCIRSKLRTLNIFLGQEYGSKIKVKEAAKALSIIIPNFSLNKEQFPLATVHETIQTWN